MMILSLMMVVSVWVKQCFLLVIWLQEDWILKVRSDIHRSLVVEHIIASLSGLEGASLGGAPHRSSIILLSTLFLLSSIVTRMFVAVSVLIFVQVIILGCAEACLVVRVVIDVVAVASIIVDRSLIWVDREFILIIADLVRMSS